ncbi:MAG: TIGR04282 family arsenosugar biosynthesis glycosyltransferase [Chromatiaceae bacterium]|nr:TIGR04282 family arsenosugar biosynthesis glycosyltransferase [Chromatiaceae bacterium]MCP5441679.1 TIGR04282 family arsenosugar biosynthesis glycosyltransferase [Chromatiaceae bacterium]
MRFPQAQILLFAKAPEAGRVKTRLIPVLGAEGAAGLYRRLLRSTILWIKDAEIAPLICCCAPGADHKEFLLLSRDIGLTMESQLGSDLGERMAHAASSRLVSGRTVVLIGGDCPALQPRHLLQTLTWLDGDCDAVIGPAEDGGYVLLGLKKCSPELFRGIAWGGDTVLEETRSRLQELRWQWRELEPLWDLDRPADLERFREMSD